MVVWSRSPPLLATSQGNVDVVDRTGHAGVEDSGLVYVESYGKGRERAGIKASLCFGGERYVTRGL